MLALDVVDVEPVADAAVSFSAVKFATAPGGSWERRTLYGGPPHRRIWFSGGTFVALVVFFFGGAGETK